MKAFRMMSSILECRDFSQFARNETLCARDLLITNEVIYETFIAPLKPACQTLFQENFGSGEPTDTMVDAILIALQGTDFDRIVAVGGGTVMDIAKILSVAEKEQYTDTLFEHRTNLHKIHPLFIVPTTCGTGSEVTNYAIVNRTGKGGSAYLVSSALFADCAVLIPSLLMSLPYSVFAASSIDAMIHAVESYLSPNACTLSMLFSGQALHLILQGWKTVLAAGSKEIWKEHAADFLRASNYAGIASCHAGCAAVHAISTPPSSLYHIPHGQAVQLLFADVMRRYQEKKPIGKLNQLEDLLAFELNVDAVFALEKLYEVMDAILPKAPLREHGVITNELPDFVQFVQEKQRELLKNNYALLTDSDILTIYRRAF